MALNHQECIDLLKRSIRWRQDVEVAAEALKDKSVHEIESLMKQLISEGEEKAVGILLNVIALNRTKISVALLCDSIKVVADIGDVCHPFALYDAQAIEPLMTVSMQDDLSWERQAMGIRLAAELAIRFDTCQKQVRKCAMKLERHILSHEAGLLNRATLWMLDDQDLPMEDIDWFTDRDVLEALPEEKPPVVIGGGYTVRRVTKKLRRNDPCHCGSNIKYKHCCYENDQDLERDASSYQGITRTQILTRPGMVPDGDLIMELRPHKIKKLNPEELSDEQLFTAYLRAKDYNLLDVCFNMLSELTARPGKTGLASEHMCDLLDLALMKNRLDLAKKVRPLVDKDLIMDFEDIDFQMHMLENSDYYQKLEAQCLLALQYEHSGHIENPLAGMAYHFSTLYPALSIMLSRAAIISRPDCYLDNNGLLNLIMDMKLELDLEGDEDTAEDFMDWVDSKSQMQMMYEAESRELHALQTQLKDSQKNLEKHRRELANKQVELERLERQMEKREAQSEEKSVSSVNNQTSHKSLENLYQRVEELKGEIRNQQEDRRELRQLLSREKEKVLRLQREDTVTRDDDTESVAVDGGETEIIIPEFTSSFQKACRQLPNTITQKALQATMAFATHDRNTWKETKKLEELDQVYRIRIGIHYRLLLEWQKGKSVRALDLISRSDLETWIKRYA